MVGPICESADYLGHERLLPPTREGDVLLIANAGAYGHAMSSQLQPARAGAGNPHLARRERDVKTGIVGWRGMVGSVLMERMRAERDFDAIEPVFFSTSQAGGAAPDVGRGAGRAARRERPRRRWRPAT